MEGMVNEKDRGLTGLQLLSGVYREIRNNTHDQIALFQRLVIAQFMSDGDFERERTAGMIHTEAVLYRQSRSLRAVSFGVKDRSTLGESFASCITAARIEDFSKEDRSEAAREALKNSKHFKETLLISMADGRIGYFEDSDFHSGLRNIFFRHELAKELNRDLDGSRGYALYYSRRCASDERIQYYAPELVPFLAQALHDVLQAH